MIVSHLCNAMKIAFIVMGYPVISESFIHNQIAGMVELGHDVEIFAQQSPIIEKQYAPYKETLAQTRKIFYLNNIAKRKLTRLMVAAKLILRYGLRYPLVILRSLNFVRYGRRALSLRLMLQIAPFLGKTFCILHSHFGANGNFGLILKEIGIAGVHITTFHGYDVNKVLACGDTKLYRDLFESRGLFTVNTRFLSRQLQKLGCPKEKILVLPVGVCMAKFRFRARKLDIGQNVELLTVSRLVEEKGLQYMLYAVKKLVRLGYSIHYTIVGYGPLHENLNELSKRLGIDNRVSFVGAVAHDRIRPYFDNAHIFVLPSVMAKNGGIEAQGLVIQEAQACGLPVVASKIGGIPEGILIGESGFLVPEKDAGMLARRIKHLIDNSQKWPQMGRCGRDFVSERYSSVDLIRQLEKIYVNELGKTNDRSLVGKFSEF